MTRQKPITPADITPELIARIEVQQEVVSQKARKRKRADAVERASRWAKRHPQRRAVYARRRDLKARYGIAEADWAALFEAQGRKCAICETPEPCRMGWHTDHCHDTGRVRGILCRKCNVGIGHFKDSPTLLSAALDYLRR